MALEHGTAPKRFKSGKDKQAYEIGASRGYSHAAYALAYGGNPDTVGELPTGLRGHWIAWQAGWEAGTADAREDHEA